jgi:hypothetical protein
MKRERRSSKRRVSCWWKKAANRLSRLITGLFTEQEMRSAWCWRCKATVPMLDENEFARIKETYAAGLSKVKHARSLEGRPLSEGDRNTIYGEAASLCQKITGTGATDAREVLRHRLSLVGPPCQHCGKELRTPHAKKCLECGCVRD